MAITSLVLGILSFLGLCCYAIPGIALGITALILGRVALGRIRASNGTIGGQGMAQAGWILGLVATILGVVGGLVWFLFFVVFGLIGAFGSGGGFSPTPTP
jgi:hypothetical protein